MFVQAAVAGELYRWAAGRNAFLSIFAFVHACLWYHILSLVGGAEGETI